VEARRLVCHIESMQIVINGEQRETRDETTIAGLLADLELNPVRVAVEVNYDLVPREQHAAHVLGPGDLVEIVTLVGGG
jgi:thiamine biosynthesis protein ThiS